MRAVAHVKCGSRIVPCRRGPVSWMMMRLSVRFSATFLAVAALVVFAGVRAQAQSTAAQTAGNGTYIAVDPLANVRYDNRYDLSVGFAYDHMKAGPTLLQGSNLGGLDVTGSYWLTKHWAIEATGRGYLGTSGAGVNTLGIQGPFVAQYIFAGGPEWLGPHNKHGAPDMRDTTGSIAANFICGRSRRTAVPPLTRDRAKPAVPFGGHYRIIDITLSNCINSGLRRVYILTQYKALAQPAHPRRLDGHCGAGAGRVLRADAAHAAHRRQLVHGHGGRGVPEHLLDRQRAAQARDHSGRRPHLQDGLQPHAGLPQGDQRRDDAGHAAHCTRRGVAVRRGGGRADGEKFSASRRSRRRPVSARRSTPTRWTRRWAFTSSTPKRC
jgi:hypothetical protein